MRVDTENREPDSAVRFSENQIRRHLADETIKALGRMETVETRMSPEEGRLDLSAALDTEDLISQDNPSPETGCLTPGATCASDLKPPAIYIRQRINSVIVPDRTLWQPPARGYLPGPGEIAVPEHALVPDVRRGHVPEVQRDLADNIDHDIPHTAEGFVDQTARAFGEWFREKGAVLAAHAITPGLGVMVEAGMRVVSLAKSAAALGSDDPDVIVPVGQFIPGLEFEINVPLAVPTVDSRSTPQARARDTCIVPVPQR